MSTVLAPSTTEKATASTYNNSAKMTTLLDDGHIFLPVLGQSGVWFWILQFGGVSSLFISICFSFGLIFYLGVMGKRQKRPFWTWKLPERLVIYLALCDLFWSTVHSFDHYIMIVLYDHVPDLPCIILGFLLNEFIFMQVIIVMFTAIGAFVLVVNNKRIPLGRYDWRLFAVSIGLPTVTGLVMVYFDLFGPSGAWCHINGRNPLYGLVMSITSFVILFASLFNLVCYASVVFTIWRISKSIAQFNEEEATKKTQCIKTAKTLVIFVIAFLGQWWGHIFYSFWSFREVPPIWVLLFPVTFTNMGGVFNFFAYRSFRKSLVGSERNSSGANSSQGCTPSASISASKSMAESNTTIVSTNQ